METQNKLLNKIKTFTIGERELIEKMKLSNNEIN